jgi:hypothetical protein
MRETAPVTTNNWVPRCAHDAAAIRVGDKIRCKETFQGDEISILGGGDEGVEKAPLLGRTDGRAT